MKQTFLNLIANGNKMVIPIYNNDYRHYIFKDVYKGISCFVIYCRKPGSYWNLSGSHWFYYHDAATGEFIESFNGGVTVPTSKERLLKADFVLMLEKYNTIHKKAA